MAAYRKNASNDRDALFGGLSEGTGGSSSGKGGGGTRSTGTKSKPSRPAPAAASNNISSNNSNNNDPMARLREMKKNKNRRPALSGEVRETKLKEAKDYKDKANKCLQKSFLGPKPDPVAASTYYKRAADAYQQVGDMPREERLYRLESGRCNEMIGAWASVASDYTRAAELLALTPDDETVANPSQQAAEYHQKAAFAWTQLNEKSKAAGSQIKAAVALNTGSGRTLSKPALTTMEEAIEAHVPDVFNPYARFRQTGHSAFIDPESEETVLKPSPETLELAKEHMVTAAYSHEGLLDLVHLLVEQYREYPTALYACGAASALLEKDGHSTISLSRAYLTETVLLLAIGDAVAAQEVFLNRHVQKTFYLTARECKLAEELFRAILDRDPEALDETRSPAGDNKAALANLHSSLRQLVKELRVSGVAKKKKEKASTSSSVPATSGDKKKKKKKPEEEQASGAAQEATLNDLMNMKTGYEKEVSEGANLNTEALSSELDNLDFGLGDSDEEGGNDDDDDDDEFDLR